MNLAALYAAHKTAFLAAGGVGVVGLAVVAKKRGGSSAAAPALGTIQNPATYDTTGTDVASQLSDVGAQFGGQLGAYQDWVAQQRDQLQAAGTLPETPTQATTTGVTTGGTTTVAATPVAPRPAPKLGKPKAIVRHPAPAKKAARKKKTPARLPTVRKAAPKPAPKKKAAPKKKITARTILRPGSGTARATLG